MILLNRHITFIIGTVGLLCVLQLGIWKLRSCSWMQKQTSTYETGKSHGQRHITHRELAFLVLLNDFAMQPLHHSDFHSQRWSVPPARCGHSWSLERCSNACSRQGRFGNLQQVRYWKFRCGHVWTLIFAVLLSHVSSCWMPFHFARPPSLFLRRLGSTALHQAAMNGHLSIVQMLVAANSDVNIQCR